MIIAPTLVTACTMVAVVLLLFDRTAANFSGCVAEKILLAVRDSFNSLRSIHHMTSNASTNSILQHWNEAGPTLEGPVPVQRRKFVINGWRWHTMSAIRDLDRFSRVIEHLLSRDSITSADLTSPTEALTLNDAEAARLSGCHEFVFNFNIAGLQRVESELIAPFLRSKLPTSVWPPQLDDLLYRHTQVIEYSKQICSLCDSLVVAASSSSSQQQRNEFRCGGNEQEKVGAEMKTYTSLSSRQLLLSMGELVHKASTRIEEIKSMQESFFMPFIASHLEPDTQEALNRRVVSTLGLLDAQVHLASMRAGIDGDPSEIELFRTHLPAAVHRLMPFWTHMYASRTRCLEA